MTDTPIQQEGESDEAYQKRIAANVEQELISNKPKEYSGTNLTSTVELQTQTNTANTDDVVLALQQAVATEEERRKQKRAAYMKKYRQDPVHKARKNELARLHYPENREHKQEQNRQSALRHIDRVRAYHKNYWDNNKDEINAKRRQDYAENKLGEAICSFCGDVYHITNTSTTLCQKCLKQAYENEKNDSQYATPDRLEHRRKMLEWGLITQEQFDNPDIVVHHVDGIRDHDVKDNLIAITRGDHTKIHNYHRKLIKQCAEKGTTPPSIAEVTKSAIEQFNIKILSKGE